MIALNRDIYILFLLCEFMAKKVKKKIVRKGKESEDKKEEQRKVSNKKVKVIEEELKNIKLIGKKSEETNEEIPEVEEEQKKDFLEIDEEPITHLEEFLGDVKAPVLERIAISETVSSRFFAPTSGNLQDDQENSEFTYKTSQDYFQSREGPTVREENGVQYSERPSDYQEASATQNEDEIEESRRLLTGGDMSQIGRTNEPIERQAFVKQDRETKKYLVSGDDYKS